MADITAPIMTETFTRKKVESLTLGEKLARLRTDMRLSLSEVSKAIKVQVKYLEFLERGQYDRLPADVYVRGYLRSYARYLNLDEKAMLRLYEQERNINQAIHPEDQRAEKRFSMPKTGYCYGWDCTCAPGSFWIFMVSVPSVHYRPTPSLK